MVKRENLMTNCFNGMDIIGNIFETLGLASILTAGVCWLIKRYSELQFEKQLRFYELELQHKSDDYKHKLDLSLENHRSELNLLFEKASKLHDKRLEIISKLYELLVNLEGRMQIMTQEWKLGTLDEATNKRMEEDRITTAGNSYNEFSTFYTANKIFFNEKTCEIINKIRTDFYDSYWDYTAQRRFGFTDFKLNYENAKKASSVVREHIPPALKQLEADFRSILGVN